MFLINAGMRVGCLPVARCPNRVWKCWVVTPAGYYVPVEVRRLIAKAGKVDFLGVCALTQSALNRKDNLHQAMLISRCEVGHLTHVSVENDATEPRIAGVIDENDSTECIAPEGQASVVGA